jgi:hypothetical protein
MYWQLQTMVKQGKPGPVTVAVTAWLGYFERENPLPGKPVLSLLMPESVFTGLHVQPEPCQFMKETFADGRLSVTRSKGGGGAHPPMRPPASAK